MLKSLFVLEMFSFLFWVFGYVEKRLDEKAMVYVKIYDVTGWTKIITIHILPNISRSKGNQTMKFAQLTWYNMKNHTKNVVEKLVPNPLIKNQN